MLEGYEYRVESLKQKQAIIFGRAQEVLGVCYFALHFELSFFDVLGGERIVEVRVDQLLLLPFQLLESLALLCEKELARFEVLIDRLNGCDSRLRDLVGREPSLGLPLLQYCRFDLLDADVRQVARGATRVTTETEEVFVDATLAAGLTEAHPPAAPFAAQRPFEWVVQLP